MIHRNDGRSGGRNVYTLYYPFSLYIGHKSVEFAALHGVVYIQAVGNRIGVNTQRYFPGNRLLGI